MEKRTLLAIALSLAILLIYQYFFLKTTPPPVTEKPVAEKGAVQESAKPPMPSTQSVASVPVPAVVAGPAKEVTVDNELMTAVFLSGLSMMVR